MASSYPYPSWINVHDFVSTKLSKTNYNTWKKPMLDLIKRHSLDGFINGDISAPPAKIGYRDWKRSDELVRGWILATLGDDDIRTRVEPLRTAQQVWMTLEKEQKTGWIDRSRYLPLLKAVIDGDCDKTRKFLEKEDDGVRVPLTDRSSTALMIAIDSFRGYDLVKELVDMMSPADLAQANASGRTALHFAAKVGYNGAAKLLVSKNSLLPNIGYSSDNILPVHEAAAYGHKEMVLYLSTVTKFQDAFDIKLVKHLIAGRLYGIALTVVQRYPKLAHQQPSPLEQIARMLFAFPSSTRLNFWQRLIYSYVHVENMENYSTGRGDIESAQTFIAVSQKQPGLFWKVIEKSVPQIKYVREKKLIHHQALQLVKFLCMEIVKLDHAEAFSILREVLETAASDGVHEVVEEIIYSFPSAIYYYDNMDQSIFHLAIVHRHENVFNILYQIGEYYGSILSVLDKSENNGLHLAGCLGSRWVFNLRASAAGAILQMQRELQWFKEVKKFIPIHQQDMKNKDGKTPAMIFTETHHELVKEGDKWTKNTANSCIIVAALFVTIVFAAAIIVPGGTNDATGLPFFARKKAYIIFAISDVLALFSSTSSVLMFLSILTSHYAEEDFLFNLPNRLIIGIATLFLSILFMMIAFGATLKILFGDKDSWILIPVVVLACIPITLFASFQFPLLVVMIKSTYGPGMFGKQHDRRFS